MSLLLAILSGFAVAMAAPALVGRLRGASGWLLAILPAMLVAYFGSLLPRVAMESLQAFRLPGCPNWDCNMNSDLIRCTGMLSSGVTLHRPSWRAAHAQPCTADS